MLERPRQYCATCRKPLDLDKKAGRRDECPSCGAELHACLNCQHYDARLQRGCREPQAADEVRDVVRANFCQWFDHRLGLPEDDRPATGDSAKAAFESLFGGRKPAAEPAKDEAVKAFEKLFKR
jgi:predicted RNA-binding Zn-ribbon protein involved in translation (DUF1610 family)